MYPAAVYASCSLLGEWIVDCWYVYNICTSREITGWAKSVVQSRRFGLIQGLNYSCECIAGAESMIPTVYRYWG